MKNPIDDFLKSLDDIPPPPPPIQRGPWPSYCPSNGTEGIYFEEEFCFRCANEDMDAERWCDIHTDALFYRASDERYPAEWWVYFNGKPTCLAFKDKDDDGGSDKPEPSVPDDPTQLDMFLELPVVEVSQ